MSYIGYRPEDELAADERVADRDNIVQIHRVHPATMRHHYDLYVELMHGPGPLSRRHREMAAIVASGINGCRY